MIKTIDPEFNVANPKVGKREMQNVESEENILI